MESIIACGPLEPVAAASLLAQALEVCELLSAVLAEEAVWVETSLQSVVVGAEGTGRGVTFWIAPLKWLGKNDGQRGLESIVALTEEIMGWTGKTVSDQAGNGLGGWLKWLRGKARTTTLHEAREMLASSIGVGPPTPAKNLVRQATRPMVIVKKKKKKSRLPIVSGAVAVLLALASVGYWLIKRNDAANGAMRVEASLRHSQSTGVTALSESPAADRPESRSVGQMNREAAEFLATTQDRDRETDARRLAIEKQGNVFTSGDRELLLERKNSEAQLGGRLVEVRFSDNGKGATLYLEFSKPAAKDEPRGYIMRKDLTAGMTLESFQKFIGKNVKISGRVNTPSSQRRPEIEIKNLAAIQEVK